MAIHNGKSLLLISDQRMTVTRCVGSDPDQRLIVVFPALKAHLSTPRGKLAASSEESDTNISVRSCSQTGALKLHMGLTA